MLPRRGWRGSAANTGSTAPSIAQPGATEHCCRFSVQNGSAREIKQTVSIIRILGKKKTTSFVLQLNEVNNKLD